MCLFIYLTGPEPSCPWGVLGCIHTRTHRGSLCLSYRTLHIQTAFMLQCTGTAGFVCFAASLQDVKRGVTLQLVPVTSLQVCSICMHDLFFFSLQNGQLLFLMEI